METPNRRILLIGDGYVGSRLWEFLGEAGFSVVCCDCRPSPRVDFACRYQDLTDACLREFDEVLWFAGHSSVKTSVDDPRGAIENNCVDLFTLARRLDPGSWLTYASSASLYSRPDYGAIEYSGEASPLCPSMNAYDASKLAFDAISTQFLSNTTGLRMGTVSGLSPRLRSELVFNAMVTSAVREGVVRVSNSSASRALVFLDDLGLLIMRLLGSSRPRPRLINCGSLNITFGELARTIAESLHAEIEVLPDSGTYSFAMDTSLAERRYGIRLRDRDELLSAIKSMAVGIRETST